MLVNQRLGDPREDGAIAGQLGEVFHGPHVVKRGSFTAQAPAPFPAQAPGKRAACQYGEDRFDEYEQQGRLNTRKPE